MTAVQENDNLMGIRVERKKIYTRFVIKKKKKVNKRKSADFGGRKYTAQSGVRGERESRPRSK